MLPLTVSIDHARRFLVRRQLLDPPRSLPASPASVLQVVEQLGSLQFDPLEVPGARNHDLVLHARIRGYERAWCDLWLYGPPGERRLFEAYNKSLNILPAHELPYYRLAWARAAERYRDTILKKSSRAVREVIERLTLEGPLSTAAFTKHMGQPIDWHWAPTAEGRAVLEALFETGRVGIARRDGNRRTYDLIERLFPAELLATRVPPKESIRHRLLSRYRGVGLMGASSASELTNGTGKAAERAAVVAELVARGTLVPIAVEGVRGLRYALADELPLLDAIVKRRAPSRGQPEHPPGVTFLAPLDPLMWDRRLLRSLFDFEYIWEVYTPAAKRRHGYYVLPILFGHRFVGRIEPRIERATATLHIASIWFETGFQPLEEPGFAAALAEALNDYRRFVGAARVTWPRTRLATALTRAIRESALS